MTLVTLVTLVLVFLVSQSQLLVLAFFINPIGASEVDPGRIEFKPEDQFFLVCVSGFYI